ncbi:hypothetical protein WT71_17710 [Burkholderia stagnalis]|nr:hypothetical protein WT71_17710 [Burkholderia stagnalis]KWI80672.1 hypothetical protein WT73_28370 [Burkholderia stagnalis]
MEATLLSALKGAPFCLPKPSFGVQLQRVLFQSVSIAHDAPTTATVFQHDRWMSPDPAGVTIETLQTQVFVGAAVDLVRVQAIQDSPNGLVPSEIRLQLELAFDIDCVIDGDGNPVITRRGLQVRLDALAVTAAGLPDWIKTAIDQWMAARFGNANGPFAGEIAKGEAWIAAQIGPVLPPSSIPITLTSLLPPAAPFINAGISVDKAMHCLCVRVEPLTSNSAVDIVWKNFLDGYFESHLGANAWAVVVPAADLKLALQTRLWSSLADAMGSDRWRLITMTVDYSTPQSGVAQFTVTPYFDVPMLPTQQVPMSISLSYDAAAGRLQVDLDAYGLRERISHFERILDTVLSILLPMVGVIAIEALHQAIADAESAANQAVGAAGGQALTNAYADAKFEILPGLPFRYRALLPLVAPASIPGRISELRADPESVALCGTGGALHWRDADLKVDVSQFGWVAPRVSCNTVGSAVENLRRDPTAVASLFAQISLGSTGSAPIKLCGVDVLDDGGAPGGLHIAPSAGSAPMDIEIRAASAFADLPTKRAARLNVRTTAGVFFVVLDPPKPISQDDIRLIADVLEVQRMQCERVLPPWFQGHGRFNLDWIVNPLIDPDPGDMRVRPEIVHLEVAGLRAGARLTLDTTHGTSPVQIAADAVGGLRLSTMQLPGKPAPYLQLHGESEHEAFGTNARTMGVQLTRQPLDPIGTLLLPGKALSLEAAAMQGADRFVVVVEDACVSIDASHGHPRVERVWSTPGVRGVVSIKRRLWAWGPAGVVWLDAKDGVVPVGGRARGAVLDAAAGAGWIALLLNEGVLLCNDYGGEIAMVPMEDASAVGFIGSALVSAGSRALRLHRFDARGRPQGNEQLAEWGADRLEPASLTGSLFARREDGRWTEIRADAQFGTTYSETPWEIRTVRTGLLLARLGDGLTLELYRANGSPQLALPKRE